MIATVDSDKAIGRCPMWCDGHSDTLHYSNEFNFEDGSPNGSDHGLVLTLVQPDHLDGEDRWWNHGEEAWVPARLNVSLFQKIGAVRPTISLDGPRKPFQMTVEEAERLRDALSDLLDDVDRDLKSWLAARAESEVTA